jgi:chromate reductase, NAD(P)H dehydrogenase (quinone)
VVSNTSLMVFTVLGISGSLRSQSSNTGLVAMAQRLAPANLRFEVTDMISALPFYNADLDTPDTWPVEVRQWRTRVEQADALWIATPEYSGGPTAVIKNAIDWVSRPMGQQTLTGKVISLASSAGGGGGAKILEYLTGVLTIFGNTVVSEPSLSFALGAQRISSDGTTSDAEVEELVSARLQTLAAALESRRLSAAKSGAN